MQMPELDGLGVVEAVGADQMPLTIFVTAFDEYAVRAFEAQAIDYLLKPFARPRFQQALDRARRHLERHRRAELSGQLLSVVASLRARAVPGPRLMVKAGGRIVFVDIESIDWVEAEGNYVRLHAGADSHLMRQTMAELLTGWATIASPASTARGSSTSPRSASCGWPAAATTTSCCIRASASVSAARSARRCSSAWPHAC